MGPTVAILGANGVYGRHLVPRLVARGHHVRALVRRPEAAAVAAACGAEIHTADIFDGASLRSALEGCSIGVNLATSLPGPSGRGDYSANDRLRREGTPIWIRACVESGVSRILQQSIAMVHGGGGDAWSDEDTPLPPPPSGLVGEAFAAVLAMEAAVQASDLDWLVLRGGLFYGPGTGFDEEWRSRALSGKLRLPADADAYASLVHVADMAEATANAIDHWPSRQRLIVADDEPVRWRDLLGHVAATVRAAPPEMGDRPGLPSFRVSNRRARRTLSWAPFYRDYRVGLAT